jgi:antitoxin component YwqK of YwqJK toxin-antitoxin module
MKYSFVILILLSCALAGCRNTAHQNVIVKETYIHKYGVPVTKEDWEQQGKEGQTICLRSDGVSITTSFKNGIVHGPTTYSFPNLSTIQTVETYSEGELIAKKENFPSGVPMKEEVYEENALVNTTYWYEDGTPQAHENYLDSFLMTGEYRTPLNDIESRVQDGYGIRIWRSNEGELLAKDTIDNGQMVEKITYYANGDPATITSYENGQSHGIRLTFLQGGLPNTVEQWIHGIQEGMTVVYLNGEKIAEVPFLHGRKNGIENRYRDGSSLVEEITWLEDLQHGERKLYFDGEVKSEWYHLGEMVSRTTFERLNLPQNNFADKAA